MQNKFILFCEPCGHKHFIFEDTDDLLEIKRVDVPGGTPFIDPETKSVKEKKKTPQPKAYKCPKCGRGVVAKRLPGVYEKAQKEEDRKVQEEQDRIKWAKIKEEEEADV